MSDPAQQPSSGPSLEVRIRLVLWILVGGMLVVATGGVLSALALADASRDVESIERATVSLGGVLEGMIEQESGVRGFILTGQEPFLEAYGPGGANADSSRELLGDLVADLSNMGLDDLDAAVAEWREIADEEIALVRSGQPDIAVAIVESGAAKQRFDTVRASVRRIDERLGEVIDARNRRQADLEWVLAIIGVLVLVGAFVVIAATLRWLHRSVTRPLAILTGAVADHDEHPLDELAGGAAGEIAAVAQSAERLRLDKNRERNEAVLVAEQTERSRIAADLHDGPVQELFALQLRLQQLVTGPNGPEVVVVLGSGIDVLEKTQEDLRLLMFDLAPPGLGLRPLSAVLAATVPQALHPPARAVVDVPDGVEFGATSQLVICRVIVEAVRNVNRHAAATTVSVRVVRSDDIAIVDVIDDGVGFEVDTASTTGHFGLGIMRSLVESMGGTFTVTSAPGLGTTVHFVVPA